MNKYFHPQDLCICGHSNREHVTECAYVSRATGAKCRCQEFVEGGAALGIFRALKIANAEMIFFAEYLDNCSPDAIIDNLRSTIANLKAKQQIVEAALRKGIEK